MRKIFLYSILSLFIFISCDDSDHPTPKVLNNRTVILYIIGDNNLSKYAEINTQELLKGTTSEKLNNGNLVLYIDDRDKKQSPRIIQIKMQGEKAVTETVKTYDEQDSTNPEVMKMVLQDIREKFKSDSYGLVLWSHASAWLPKVTQDLIATRSFGNDEDNEMEIDVLKDALSGFHFDFILFDACYMASVEVAYELRNIADYIIASPMEVIAKGFPYEHIVGKLLKMPNADLQGICKDFYDFYNVQTGDSRTASVSLVDTKKLEKLAGVMRGIMKEYKSKLPTVNLYEVQALEYYHHKRLLYDFDDYMKHLTNNFSGEKDYRLFRAVLREVVIYEAHTPTSYFAYPRKSILINKCCGLSVYPLGFNPSLDQWYERLEWYKDVYR